MRLRSGLLRLLLQRLLGLPQPDYHHHRLITGADGKRLAKSADSATLRTLREAGASAADIRAQLGFG